MKKNPKENPLIKPSKYNYAFNIRNYVDYTQFLIIVVTALVTLGGAYYAFFETPQYQATVLLNTKMYGSLSALATSNIENIPLDNQAATPMRQIQLMQTYAFMKKVAAKIDPSGTTSGATAQDLLDGIVFEIPEVGEKLPANLIKISFANTDPAKTADVVNAVAEIAVEGSKEREKQVAAEMSNLLEVQRANLLSLLDQYHHHLADISQGLNRISMNGETHDKYIADTMAELNKSIINAKSQLVMLSHTVTEKNSEYIAAQNLYESLIEERWRIENENQMNFKHGSSIQRLQREINIYTDLYKQITNDWHDFQGRQLNPIGDLSLVELATVPDHPISYSRPVIILLSLIVGLICGYVVAVALD